MKSLFSKLFEYKTLEQILPIDIKTILKLNMQRISTLLEKASPNKKFISISPKNINPKKTIKAEKKFNLYISDKESELFNLSFASSTILGKKVCDNIVGIK